MTRDWSSSEETKAVQTELSVSRLERFKRAARECDLTVEEAAAEALVEFTQRYQPVDRDDSLFTPLDWDDEVDRTDDASERIDEIVYGADGREGA